MFNPRDIPATLQFLPSLPDAPRHTWTFRRARFRERLLSNDLSHFLQWPECHDSLFVGETPDIRRELDELSLTASGNKLLGLAHDPGIGSPSLIDNWTTGTLIHQAYYLHLWEKLTGKKHNALTSVLEIGAGYGAMALLLLRANPQLRYLAIDFPELLLLQSHYLSGSAIPGNWTWTPLLSPNSTCNYVSLLIACCSLSEISIDERLPLIGNVAFRSALIVFQHTFYDINNLDWFQEWILRYPHHRWQMKRLADPGSILHDHILLAGWK